MKNKILYISYLIDNIEDLLNMKALELRMPNHEK